MPPELCRMVWAYLTGLPPVVACLDVQWWPWWERHVVPRALETPVLYAARCMLPALVPWPPQHALGRLVWWLRGDAVAVQLATQEVVVASITSIMHVKKHAQWERHVRTSHWGDLIRSPAGTVFEFRGTGRRVAVIQSWRLNCS